MGLTREEDEGWDAPERFQRGNQPEQTSTHAATNRLQAPILDSFQPKSVSLGGRAVVGALVWSFSLQMTWNSTMSSGYSSLEEDSEEYFFTARTSFIKKPGGKVTEGKVKTE